MIDPPPMSLPFRKAIEEAQKSTHRYRLGAVIVRKGKIIGRGFNKLRGHKWSSYYQYAHSCHAEVSSLLGLPDGRARGCDIYVARILNSGNIGLAKPCASCTTILKEHGIKNVYYTR